MQFTNQGWRNLRFKVAWRTKLWTVVSKFSEWLLQFCPPHAPSTRCQMRFAGYSRITVFGMAVVTRHRSAPAMWSLSSFFYLWTLAIKHPDTLLKFQVESFNWMPSVILLRTLCEHPSPTGSVRCTQALVSWLQLSLSSCLYRASVTIKTLYYPTAAQIYNSQI